MPNPIELVRVTHRLLGALAPGLAAKLAHRLFTSPRRHTPPTRELEAAAGGERIHAGGGSALRWRTGGDRARPRILALHGWEGRASQWGPLAEAAVAAGFEVIAPDAPGHGHSPGSRAHLGAFTRTALELDEEFGPFVGADHPQPRRSRDPISRGRGDHRRVAGGAAARARRARAPTDHPGRGHDRGRARAARRVESRRRAAAGARELTCAPVPGPIRLVPIRLVTLPSHDSAGAVTRARVRRARPSSARR